jgi:hypothetical protein
MVSGYTNYIELYWAHLIYGMVWFLAMVNMDWGGAIGKQYVQVSMHGINGMVNGMVFGWLSCTTKLNGVEDGSDVQ